MVTILSTGSKQKNHISIKLKASTGRLKNQTSRWAWYHRSVISATVEVNAGGYRVQGQPGQS
jgi:hypothetical protein